MDKVTTAIIRCGKLQRLMAIMLLLPLFPSLASADQGNGNISYYAVGAGMKTCGDFIQDLRSIRPDRGMNTEHGWLIARSSSYVHWASGFITSENIKRALEKPPREQIEYSQATIASWLENYCEHNALVSLSDAVMKMISSDRTK